VKTETFKSMYAYTDTHMTTKTISIMDDVYETLVQNKRKNESFSEVIRRIMAKDNDITPFFGLWGDFSVEEMKDISDTLETIRNKKRDYL